MCMPKLDCFGSGKAGKGCGKSGKGSGKGGKGSGGSGDGKIYGLGFSL